MLFRSISSTTLFSPVLRAPATSYELLLSFRLQDQSRLIAEISQDLRRIRNWCFDSQLLLNPNKTKLLVCDSKRGVAKARNFKLSFLGKHYSSGGCQRPWCRTSGYKFNL